jgi:hypothetical protein
MFLEFDITYYFCYGEKSVKLFQYKTERHKEAIPSVLRGIILYNKVLLILM